MLCSRDAAKLDQCADDHYGDLEEEYGDVSEDMRRETKIWPYDSLMYNRLTSKEVTECYLEAAKHD